MQLRVDRTALRFNQASIIALLLIAFLLDSMWLVAFVAAVMLIGSVWPNASLFKAVYARVLKPLGLLRPDVVADDPAPHLFAQGLGGAMLLASVVALVAGAPVIGWLLAGVVVLLAGVNLFLHFCLGCFLYYQLARRGIRVSLPAWRAS